MDDELLLPPESRSFGYWRHALALVESNAWGQAP